MFPFLASGLFRAFVTDPGSWPLQQAGSTSQVAVTGPWLCSWPLQQAGSTSQVAVTGPRLCSWPLEQAGSTSQVAVTGPGSALGRWNRPDPRHRSLLQALALLLATGTGWIHATGRCYRPLALLHCNMLVDHVTWSCYLIMLLGHVT